MPSINYKYVPGQSVYVIHDCGIELGVVIKMIAKETETTSSILYEIKLNKSLTINFFEEIDIFSDKTSAINEYDTRLPDIT